MESIKLDEVTKEHKNQISKGADQVIQDVVHRLSLRKGDYLFDTSQGVDYDIVFGKGYDMETKVDHLKAVILENKQVKEVGILEVKQEERNLCVKFSLLLEDNTVIEGGVLIGA